MTLQLSFPSKTKNIPLGPRPSAKSIKLKNSGIRSPDRPVPKGKMRSKKLPHNTRQYQLSAGTEPITLWARPRQTNSQPDGHVTDAVVFEVVTLPKDVSLQSFSL